MAGNSSCSALAFLSKRVQNSVARFETNKVRKIHLNTTRDMMLTLRVDKPVLLHCYVDTFDSVRRESKHHSGEYTTFLCGAIGASSRN